MKINIRIDSDEVLDKNSIKIVYFTLSIDRSYSQ